ncbi:hypothetical protein [Paraburkholderia bannensis]|uniref:hypothetical protein n=1 Tax=Paraburkholderia bannensis TaxID=765414 RepID=UPI002AB71C6B|nr:hypothetical protein [Paraburkholderia bannensis]
MLRNSRLASTALVVALLAGCASTQPTMNTSSTTSAPVKTNLAAGVATPTIAANGHEITPEVQDALLKSFNDQAAKDGLKVVDGGTPVTVTIDEYRARSTAARWLVGALAGNDHIRAQVTVGEPVFVIEDSAITVVNGINDVAGNVGVQLANGLAKMAGLPSAN